MCGGGGGSRIIKHQVAGDLLKLFSKECFIKPSAPPGGKALLRGEGDVFKYYFRELVNMHFIKEANRLSGWDACLWD